MKTAVKRTVTGRWSGILVVLGLAATLCAPSPAQRTPVPVGATGIERQLMGGSANSFVLPGGYEIRDAPGASLWTASPFAARRQLLIDERHLSEALMRNLTRLALRRNTGHNGALEGGKLLVEISLSHSRATASTASDAFAANRGFDHRVVFRDVVTFPDSQESPTSPAPWVTPNAVEFEFLAPFFYRGGTLCIETITEPVPDGSGGTHPAPWWAVDSVVEDIGGTVETFGDSCIPGLSGRPAGAEAGSMVSGSEAVFFLRGPRPTGQVICALGLSDSVTAGGLSLPLDLGAYSAPGCFLYVDPVLQVSTTIVRMPRAGTGLAQAAVALPSDPALVGMDIYSQWIMFEPAAPSLRFSFSNGVRATIGSSNTELGVSWIESVDLDSPVGRILYGRSPVLRISM